MDRPRLLLFVSLTFGFYGSSDCIQAQTYPSYGGEIVSEYEVPGSAYYTDIGSEHVIQDPHSVAPTDSYVVVEPKKVDWVRDYESARQLAKRKSLPVLLFITSNSCHYCELMRREVFQDEQVVETLKRSYVAAKLNIDPEGDLAKELKITLFPTTVIIDEDGNVLDYARGYRKSAEMHERIVAAATGTTRVARK